MKLSRPRASCSSESPSLPATDPTRFDATSSGRFVPADVGSHAAAQTHNAFMSRQQQLLLDFDAKPAPARRPTQHVNPDSSLSNNRLAAVAAAYPSPDVVQRPSVTLQTIVLKWDLRTSFPEPREDAIEAGKLHDTDVLPDNLRSLHLEHERAALACLAELDLITDARRRGVDPGTGKPPSTEKRRIALEERFQKEPPRLQHAFDVLMDVYAEGFGDEAADEFRKAVKARHHGSEVRSDSSSRAHLITATPDDAQPRYEPSHPWFYYKEGDHAEPLSLDAISPAELTLDHVGITLPKQAEKRRSKLAALSADAVSQLQQDERRYVELVEHGVEALSNYDRTIAYGGNDELAWASSIALCHNHVRYSRGRVRLFNSLLNQPLLTGLGEK